MMVRFGLIAAAAVVISLAGCNPTAADRCGTRYEYEPETRSCRLIEDAGTDTDTGEIDTDTELPTGFGKYCTSDADCAGLEADHCAIDPETQDGFCTVKNCTVQPNDCPVGYMCCDSPESFGQPNACISQADYDTLHGMGLCV